MKFFQNKTKFVILQTKILRPPLSLFLSFYHFVPLFLYISSFFQSICSAILPFVLRNWLVVSWETEVFKWPAMTWANDVRSVFL